MFRKTHDCTNQACFFEKGTKNSYRQSIFLWKSTFSIQFEKANCSSLPFSVFLHFQQKMIPLGGQLLHIHLIFIVIQNDFPSQCFGWVLWNLSGHVSQRPIFRSAGRFPMYYPSGDYVFPQNKEHSYFISLV